MLKIETVFVKGNVTSSFFQKNGWNKSHSKRPGKLFFFGGGGRNKRTQLPFFLNYKGTNDNIYSYQLVYWLCYLPVVIIYSFIYVLPLEPQRP